MDAEFALQIEARMRDWNSVVERERSVQRWKRLLACCRTVARQQDATSRSSCG
jgi:hypothetical protein